MLGAAELMSRWRCFVRRLLVTLAVVVGMALAAGSARAHDTYHDPESHPFRLIAYAVHPVGWTAEWLVFRPLHFFLSQPAMEPIFGHVPHDNAFDDYRPYRP